MAVIENPFYKVFEEIEEMAKFDGSTPELTIKVLQLLEMRKLNENLTNVCFELEGIRMGCKY